MKKPPSDPRPRPIPSSRLARLAKFGGLAAGVAGGMAREGLRRAASGERPDLRSMLLTPGNAARLANQLAAMRGAAMKMGQLMSMEGGEFLPPELADILARLRADADFMPSRQLKAVLVANWGSDFLKQFETFDTRPIAAASIGQVHRARTRDGRELAIKVQYPGVRDSIDSDVANVATLIRLAGLTPDGLDIAPLLEEAKAQLREEADYAREGGYLAAFHAKLADAPDFAVPEFCAELSTRDILAMSFMPGAPIESLAQAPQSERDRVMTRLIELFLRELFEFRLMQTDPNFANYRYDAASRRIVLLDFGATRAFSPARIESYHRFMAAIVGGEATAIERAAIEMGYLSESAPPAYRADILAMTQMAVAPLRAGGVFDFGETGFIDEVRDKGMALAAHREVDVAPPIETLFMQRKAAGLFLLGARLKARVRVRDLVDRFLAQPPVGDLALQ